MVKTASYTRQLLSLASQVKLAALLAIVATAYASTDDQWEESANPPAPVPIPVPKKVLNLNWSEDSVSTIQYPDTAVGAVDADLNEQRHLFLEVPFRS